MLISVSPFEMGVAEDLYRGRSRDPYRGDAGALDDTFGAVFYRDYSDGLCHTKAQMELCCGQDKLPLSDPQRSLC